MMRKITVINISDSKKYLLIRIKSIKDQAEWDAKNSKSNLDPSTPEQGFPGGSEVKSPPANAGDRDSTPGFGNIPQGRKWPPDPVFLPGKSHGQKSLVSHRPWGHKELDTTERPTFQHFIQQLSLHIILRHFSFFVSQSHNRKQKQNIFFLRTLPLPRLLMFPSEQYMGLHAVSFLVALWVYFSQEILIFQAVLSLCNLGVRLQFSSA